MKRNDIWKLFSIINLKPKEWQNFMYDNVLEWYCKDIDLYPDLYIRPPTKEERRTNEQNTRLNTDAKHNQTTKEEVR